MYFYMLITGKILKTFSHVQFLHKMANLCMESVKPCCFIDKYHRSTMKPFFFKVSFISHVLLYADFGKNTQKILARKVFTYFLFSCK